MLERSQTEKKRYRRNYYRELLGFYNDAAQFHALSLVAVVFGQFSILAVLPTARQSWATVLLLAVAYSLIILLGSYFFSQYLSFARRIRIIRLDGGMGEEYRELEEDLEARTSECVQDFYLGLFRKKILKVERDNKGEKRIEKHLNDLLLHVFYFAISALLFVAVTCAK